MKQEMDVASEPVDLNGDNDFMDTGVLYEQRACTKCSERSAAKGHSECSACLGTEKE